MQMFKRKLNGGAGRGARRPLPQWNRGAMFKQDDEPTEESPTRNDRWGGKRRGNKRSNAMV